MEDGWSDPSKPEAPDASSTPTITPQAWLRAAILEGIGYLLAIVIGLVVLESVTAMVVGFAVVFGLFMLWLLLAVRRHTERAPTSLGH